MCIFEYAPFLRVGGVEGGLKCIAQTHTLQNKFKAVIEYRADTDNDNVLIFVQITGSDIRKKNACDSILLQYYY